MTPSQQFYFNILTLICTVVVTPIVGLIVVAVTKRNAVRTTEELVIVKGEIRTLGVAVDGKLAALVEATGAQKFLEGQNAGRATEKAEQALRSGPEPVKVTLAETPVPVIVHREESAEGAARRNLPADPPNLTEM